MFLDKFRKNKHASEPAVYMDQMAQRNGSPVEDIPEGIEWPADDPVNHPAHYTAGGRIEVIEFLEDWNFPFHLANSIKYICRAGRKDPTKTVEDLQKAVWYINRYIGFIGRQAENVEKSGGCDED